MGICPPSNEHGGYANGSYRLPNANPKAACREQAEQPGSYVAGGLALNSILDAPRISRDIDIFHDSAEALLSSWQLDSATLLNAGYCVRPVRQYKTFIEAEIGKDGETTDIQWGADSAYRFFPLVEDEFLGYTLHPLDLATNKLAALVGRTEPRDWIDVIMSIEKIQHLTFKGIRILEVENR